MDDLTKKAVIVGVALLSVAAVLSFQSKDRPPVEPPLWMVPPRPVLKPPQPGRGDEESEPPRVEKRLVRGGRAGSQGQALVLDLGQPPRERPAVPAAQQQLLSGLERVEEAARQQLASASSTLDQLRAQALEVPAVSQGVPAVSQGVPAVSQGVPAVSRTAGMTATWPADGPPGSPRTSSEPTLWKATVVAHGGDGRVLARLYQRQRYGRPAVRVEELVACEIADATSPAAITCARQGDELVGSVPVRRRVQAGQRVLNAFLLGISRGAAAEARAELGEFSPDFTERFTLPTETRLEVRLGQAFDLLG